VLPCVVSGGFTLACVLCTALGGDPGLGAASLHQMDFAVYYQGCHQHKHGPIHGFKLCFMTH
jgi:hypothetical protein